MATEDFPIDTSRPVRVRNVALSVLTMLAAIILLRYAQALFVPFVLAALIAYGLNPFVNVLERLRIHRTASTALVLIILCGGMGAGAYALKEQATAVLDGVPTAIAKIRDEIEKHREPHDQPAGPIGKLQEAAHEIEKTTAEATDGF